jgi:hypothetical protein
VRMTKLDAYDYIILPGVIRIRLMGTNDPDIVDIMSELNRSSGSIYIEGHRFSYLNSYRLFADGDEAFIELDVMEVA